MSQHQRHEAERDPEGLKRAAGLIRLSIDRVVGRRSRCWTGLWEAAGPACRTNPRIPSACKMHESAARRVFVMIAEGNLQRRTADCPAV